LYESPAAAKATAAKATATKATAKPATVKATMKPAAAKAAAAKAAAATEAAAVTSTTAAVRRHVRACKSTNCKSNCRCNKFFVIHRKFNAF
jgi:hypothetical protein